VAQAVMHLMKDGSHWEGTATSLYELLNAYLDAPWRQSQDWPKNAVSLGSELTRIGLALKAAKGVSVERYRDSGPVRTRIIVIKKVPTGTGADGFGQEFFERSSARNLVSLQDSGPPRTASDSGIPSFGTRKEEKSRGMGGSTPTGGPSEPGLQRESSHPGGG
jgi:hypothetical protein